MKLVSEFFETSALNCETALLHAKNGKARSVNNNDDAQNLYA